jgi:hypothetical protein
MGCEYNIAMCAKKDEVDATLLLKTADKEAEELLNMLVSGGKIITTRDESSYYYYYVIRDYSSYRSQLEVSRQLDILSKVIPSFEGIYTNEENDISIYKGIKSKHLLDYYTETTFTFTFDGSEEEDMVNDY